MAKATATPDRSARPDKAEAMERYIAEIDQFAGMLRTQQATIKELEKEVAIAKSVYDDARKNLSEAKEIEHSTVSLLLKFIRPGSIDVLPLFDTMEPAEEEVHGTNADEWRKEPVVVLDLSSAALRALIDADIVLVGQLQDRILKGEEWAAGLEGINEGMAQAIEAKLQQFVDERSKRKRK
jgi:hypothetical protein